MSHVDRHFHVYSHSEAVRDAGHGPPILLKVACGQGQLRLIWVYICPPLQSLYKQMVEIFRTLGVDAVPGVGQPFDPNFHDAVMREQNDDVPDGTVLQEFRKGFRHGDKLLRPAMVKVRDLSYSQLEQAVEVAWQVLWAPVPCLQWTPRLSTRMMQQILLRLREHR